MRDALVVVQVCSVRSDLHEDILGKNLILCTKQYLIFLIQRLDMLRVTYLSSKIYFLRVIFGISFISINHLVIRE